MRFVAFPAWLIVFLKVKLRTRSAVPVPNIDHPHTEEKLFAWLTAVRVQAFAPMLTVVLAKELGGDGFYFAPPLIRSSLEMVP
jgi:hypothetical protein